MSDQYVSVPRELLERSISHLEWFGSTATKEISEIRTLIAAPAEDVRAVVEEPVYQVCNGVSGWIDVDLLRYTACQIDPEEYETRMLFVLPQRPVVMPQRKGQHHTDWRDWTYQEIGWNACMDEFERLNK